MEIRNRPGGPLDVDARGGSITMAAWVFNKGVAGPIFNYNPRGRGVRLWFITPKTLFVGLSMRGRRRRFTGTLATRQNIRFGWNFVAATYRRRTGRARLFVNNKFVARKRIGRIRLATNFDVRLGAVSGDRRYFRGMIACAQFFSKALSARQLRYRSKKCFRGKDKRELELNPLRARWPMEPALISGFCSVKRMRVFNSPWMGH